MLPYDATPRCAYCKRGDMKMDQEQKSPRALWLWLMVGTAAALMTVAVLLGLNTGSEMTGGRREKVEESCTLLQTVHYDRCGHAVTRRVEVDKEYQGATLEQMQQAFADWSITSFAPTEIVMSCRMPIYCPDHLVVMPDNAGVLGVYINELGQGYTLQRQLEAPLTDLPEDVLEKVHLGLSFATMGEIENWLETLES